MRTWDVDEYDLGLLHLDPAFHSAILKQTDHWVRRAVDVRNQIYLNATDTSKSAKEQWFWMKKYEDMLIEFVGPQAKFLPQEKGDKHEPADDSGPDDNLIAIRESGA